MRIFATIVLLFISGAALSHSWYPADCCSDRDCWPMGTDADAKEPEPKIVPGGYQTHDGIFVPESKTRPSRDGRFHICRDYGKLNGQIVGRSRDQICLFVPKGSS